MEITGIPGDKANVEELPEKWHNVLLSARTSITDGTVFLTI